MNLFENWKICLDLMYSDRYIKGLNVFLKKRKVKKVLDCSGGLGFPIINLKKLGYDVVYNDKDNLMFNYFKNINNSKIQAYNLDWKELSEKMDNNFDAILCRGNSLVYVDSWELNSINPKAKEDIYASLKEFYKLLKKDGLLYVDIINESEYSKVYPLNETLGTIEFNGKKCSLNWEVSHDYKKRTRIVKSKLVGKDFEETVVYYSYLLKHEELIEMLKDIGFTNIEKVDIDGENNYDVYIASK